jgi:hypothetical protein
MVVNIDLDKSEGSGEYLENFYETDLKMAKHLTQ